MPFAGTPLPNWADFYRLTGPLTLTGPESIPNEAQNRSFLTSWYLNGNDLDNLQGGIQIQDFIMTETGSTAQNTLPGAERSVQEPNVTEKVADEWRITEDAMVFNQIILSLNKHGGGAGSRYQAYKYEMSKIERRMATSLNNKLDNDWSAQPDVTTQVGTGSAAINPHPLWTFVNEYGADGLITDATGFPSGTGLPNGYTTISGINPTTSKWYRPWQIPYSTSISTSTVNPAASDWLTAFTKALNLVQYQQMPWRSGESTTNDPIRNPEYAVPISINGDAYIQRVMSASQNYFRMDPQDPFYPSPRYAGIPFIKWAAMDLAAVFPTSGTTAPTVGAGVTEMNADKAGPRFPLISKRWIKWFWHSDFYFRMWPTKYPSRQWDTEIHPVTCMHNRIALSRRKLAMIYPSADITI